jgi:late competence protein required for DNA uptake (superfamily II DNA/RNA helicase)
MSDHIKQRQKLGTIIVDKYSPQEVRTDDDFNELFCMLIKRVHHTTCDRCKLVCSDAFSHMACNDVPVFHCEKFLNTYSTKTDALDRSYRVQLDLWKRAEMWRGRLQYVQS